MKEILFKGEYMQTYNGIIRDKATKVVDKFNKDNLNLQKIKIKILLASMDFFWNIVDKFEDTPPSNVDTKC